MIRHHAKSFMYSESDISIMIKDIEKVKELGANGIVIGMLDKENNIEENQLKTIISASKRIGNYIS
ncbi:copper homeostasis protein CutC [Paraclostridium bifermentans]|nr:copper homeostasis protein CutC [Paraclostridium bifermentans]